MGGHGGGEGHESARRQLRRRVGENIRRLTEQRGYSLGGVANAAGLSESSFFRALTGRSSFRLDTLARLAAVLGCDPGVFLEGRPHAQRSGTDG